MKKIMYCSHLILGYCILFTACTLKNDFKITKEFADSIKQYSYISNFSGGIAEVTTGGKDGFIDKTGKQIIPCIYGKIENFSEGIAKVIVEGEYRLIPNGPFQEVKYIGKCGFIDKTGKQIIPCMYDDAENFSEGTAKVKMGEKWGFIDKNGKQIVPCIYDQVAWRFSEGLAAVKVGGKWGFIDKKGKQIIPCIYENAGSFSEGMAKVRVGGKYGFVDKYGNSTFDFDK